MNPYYYVLSVNGLLFVISLVFYFFQPKKINSIYGYRTNKTMLNQEVWDFANAYFKKQFLVYALVSLVASLIFVSLASNFSWQPMAIMLLSLAVSVIKTEQVLNKNFDDKGKKIKK